MEHQVNLKYCIIWCCPFYISIVLSFCLDAICHFSYHLFFCMEFPFSLGYDHLLLLLITMYHPSVHWVHCLSLCYTNLLLLQYKHITMLLIIMLHIHALAVVYVYHYVAYHHVAHIYAYANYHLITSFVFCYDYTMNMHN